MPFNYGLWMAHPYWPLFDLKITTPCLELRLPTDVELPYFVDLARSVVPDAKFLGPWLAVPEPYFGPAVAQFHWGCRASWKPDQWTLVLGIFLDGEPVGQQSIDAADFSTLRDVHTGSWLGPEHRGKGLGVEMRAAVLHLAFEGLGAATARSGARHTNGASLGVSKRLGYEPNGTTQVEYGDGSTDDEISLLLTRERWQINQRDDVTIYGLDGCIEMFGLANTTA